MLQNLKKHLYRAKYIYAQNLNLKKPVDVTLELSSFCTNACGYCYHASPTNLPFQRGKMSKDLAIKIIRDAAGLGVHSLKFNHRGEATMNPIFEDVTAYAKSLSKGMTFIDRITNSNFNFDIRREDIFRALCNQTKVKVSFDSFNKEIFERQRKGSNYERTIANISKFYSYPDRDNVLVIQSVRTLENKDEDLEFEIKSRWPSAQVSIRDVVEGRVNKDLSNVVIRKRDIENRQSCLQAHNRLVIHWDGKVAPCCPSIDGSLIIGDLNIQSISDVWNSIGAQKLRLDLLSKEAFKSEPCKSCSSFESYKGFNPSWGS